MPTQWARAARVAPGLHTAAGIRPRTAVMHGQNCLQRLGGKRWQLIKP